MVNDTEILWIYVHKYINAVINIYLCKDLEVSLNESLGIIIEFLTFTFITTVFQSYIFGVVTELKGDKDKTGHSLLTMIISSNIIFF